MPWRIFRPFLLCTLLILAIASCPVPVGADGATWHVGDRNALQEHEEQNAEAGNNFMKDGKEHDQDGQKQPQLTGSDEEDEDLMRRLEEFRAKKKKDGPRKKLPRAKHKKEDKSSQKTSKGDVQEEPEHVDNDEGGAKKEGERASGTEKQMSSEREHTSTKGAVRERHEEMPVSQVVDALANDDVSMQENAPDETRAIGQGNVQQHQENQDQPIAQDVQTIRNDEQVGSGSQNQKDVTKTAMETNEKNAPPTRLSGVVSERADDQDHVKHDFQEVDKIHPRILHESSSNMHQEEHPNTHSQETEPQAITEGRTHQQHDTHSTHAAQPPEKQEYLDMQTEHASMASDPSPGQERLHSQTQTQLSAGDESPPPPRLGEKHAPHVPSEDALHRRSEHSQFYEQQITKNTKEDSKADGSAAGNKPLGEFDVWDRNQSAEKQTADPEAGLGGPSQTESSEKIVSTGIRDNSHDHEPDQNESLEKIVITGNRGNKLGYRGHERDQDESVDETRNLVQHGATVDEPKFYDQDHSSEEINTEMNRGDRQDEPELPDLDQLPDKITTGEDMPDRLGQTDNEHDHGQFSGTLTVSESRLDKEDEPDHRPHQRQASGEIITSGNGLDKRGEPDHQPDVYLQQNEDTAAKGTKREAKGLQDLDDLELERLAFENAERAVNEAKARDAALEFARREAQAAEVMHHVK
jgi:hypothetical protein